MVVVVLATREEGGSQWTSNVVHVELPTEGDDGVIMVGVFVVVLAAQEEGGAEGTTGVVSAEFPKSGQKAGTAGERFDSTLDGEVDDVDVEDDDDKGACSGRSLTLSAACLALAADKSPRHRFASGNSNRSNAMSAFSMYCASGKPKVPPCRLDFCGTVDQSVMLSR